MKTTVEIPEDLFVQVKTAAAVRGMTFRDVLIRKKSLYEYGNIGQ